VNVRRGKKRETVVHLCLPAGCSVPEVPFAGRLSAFRAIAATSATARFKAADQSDESG
jgi:hypothetical protein